MESLAARVGLRDGAYGLVIAACSQATLAAALSEIAAAAPDAKLVVVLDSRRGLWEGRPADLAAAAGEGKVQVGSRFVPWPGLLRTLRRRGLDTALVVADEDRSPSRWGQALGLASGARQVHLLLGGWSDALPVSVGSLLSVVAGKLRMQVWESLVGTPMLGSALGGVERAMVWVYQAVHAPSRRPARLAEVRVLLIGSGPGASTRYRVAHKYEQLRMLGIRATARGFREYLARPLLAAKDACEHDIAIVHRLPDAGLTSPVLAGLSRRGRPIVYDIDDLIFEPELSAFVPRAARRAIADQARLLARCTHVIAATTELAERAARFRKAAATQVVGNVLSEAIVEASRRARERRRERRCVSLGYLSGSPTHDQDIAVIGPALAEILRRHPRTEVVFVGPVAVPEGLAGLGERVRTLPLMPWRGLPRLMADNIDINLAPLDINNPFCRSKSEVKYIEAGALGIPTIATPIPAFEAAISNGVNGFLAATTQEWVEALDRLLAEPELMRQVGQRALRDVEARYSPRVGAESFAEAITAILGLAGPDASGPASDR